MTADELSKFIKKPKMWRKRYIPDEIIDISSDEVLYRDNNVIVTKWETIHPRSDFQRGISFILIDEGIKISKLYKDTGEYLKCYCDIIDVEYKLDNDEYVFIDLLLDLVIISEDETRILDIGEFNEALENKIITKDQAELSIKRLKKLLDLVITNNFPPKQIKDIWEEYK